MATVDRTQPSSFAGAFAYEHTDIPPGQTIADWRRQRAEQARAAEAARRTARRERLRALATLKRSPQERGRVGAGRPAGVAR